jgi:16S rRNA (uracil1498-N3)-methyltransferase
VSLRPYVHLDVSLAGRVPGETLALPVDAVHHLTRVLRLASGAPLDVADGAGWHAPARVGDGGVELRAAPTLQPLATPRLVVAQALAKGRKLDEVVRQVTELGADGFVALRTARSVVGPDAAKQAKVNGRWEQIAWSASEQSRRARRPRIDGPIPVHGLLERPADVAADDQLVLIAHPGARPLPDVLAERSAPALVTIAIGPEGGFDDAEVAGLEAGGARTVGLGPGVLRTEHAAAAAVAACAALLGRWR